MAKLLCLEGGTLPSRPARFLAASLTILIAGCAVADRPPLISRQLPICAVPDRSAKKSDLSQIASKDIALTVGTYDPPLFVFDTVFAEDIPAQREMPAIMRNPVTGAAVGAIGGMGFCGHLLAIPPLAIACLPVGAAVGTVAGGVMGGVAMSKEGSPEKPKQAAPQPNYAQQKTDREVANQHIASSIRPVDLHRILKDKIITYARQAGINDLTELADQGPISPVDTPQYRTPKDYVLEITLSERTVNSWGQNSSPVFYLGFSALGRIVRVSDKTILHTFSAHEFTKRKNTEEWAANNGEPLITELNNALERLAKTAADQWIPKTVNTDHFPNATFLIYRPKSKFNSQNTVKISVDGCLASNLAEAEYIKFQTTAGNHIIRTENSNRLSGFLNYLSVELKPEQTCYLETSARGSFAGFRLSRCEEGEGYPDVRARLLRDLKEHGQGTSHTITQTPDAPPAAIIADPSPKSPSSEPCIDRVFPRETNPLTAEARDILENRCRN